MPVSVGLFFFCHLNVSSSPIEASTFLASKCLGRDIAFSPSELDVLDLDSFPKGLEPELMEAMRDMARTAHMVACQQIEDIITDFLRAGN